MMSVIKKIFGDPTLKEIGRITKLVVEPVNTLELEIAALSDEGLRAKTAEFKQQLASGKTLDDILVPAFAVVREAAKRVLGMRHFDVQLIGGATLHRGQIAEMKTGEGKTLVATLSVYLNALEGNGVHVVTVNDYLSKRDGCWMGQVYSFLGLSVGILQNQLVSYLYDPFNTAPDYLERVIACSRRDAYAADITYGTNNEFGFDYLRDNMVVDLPQMVQRGLHYGIVDEIDSILIDEARTPLIISAPAEESADLYYKFAQLVTRLQENIDYNIDEKMRSSTLTDAGVVKLEKALGLDNIYAEGGITTVHHIEQALRAYALFKRDRDYVVKDGEVIIVDEFTGRLMPGRRYSEGLHQAIEAKEGVQIQRESQTLATITFQNYFRMYKKLSGMTGTAATEAEEFGKIYNLEVLEIPTNRPLVRKDLNDRIYKNESGKFMAVAKGIKELQAKGQPVLVGTISIEKNEILSELLTREGVAHEILNAKNHEREAQIIADAGRVGAVTLATNMAGRGVDIILGGKPPDKASVEYVTWQAEHEQVVELGGLFVLGTERHESRRIDNQLRGRAGRQGDPGASQFYISLEDDLMRIFGPERVKSMMNILKVPDDMPIENKLITRSLESAQKKVEGHNFDIRKHLVEYDDVINKQRETIYRRRRTALAQSDDLKEEVLKLVKEELTAVVNFHTQAGNPTEWDLEEIYEVAHSMFPVDSAVRLKMAAIELKGERHNLNDEAARAAIINYLFELAVTQYNGLAAKAKESLGQDGAMNRVAKGIVLQSIDTLWVDHLDAMDHMRRGIGLRGYGQRDPLLEYKKESFRLFQQLLEFVRKQIVYSIFKVGLAADTAQSLLQRQGVSLSGAQKTMGNNVSFGGVAAASQAVALPAKAKDDEGNKVGRNDPCPCGATKPDGTPVKYKHCHGK
ncbi:preprotein translocase subunit SecA [Candidatus Falkowbacteria bacterium]|nr:preprotein translocase subunit SecA [Candidatus Falkowbacteria bacterium]